MSADISSAGHLQLTIGSSVFTASTLDNPSASAFRALLPLNLQMLDLHGNEKYADLSIALPTAATDLGSIRAGDLMLYGSRTLVLWYEDYSNSYTYTRIGHITDPKGLASAVGEGEVNVGFTTEGSDLTPSSSENRACSRVNVSRYGRPLVVLLCIRLILAF